MVEKLKLNKQGYESYLREIEKKEGELARVRMYKGSEAIYQGDNWHDNPTLYQTEAEERTLMREIAEMKFKLQNAEIIENLEDETLIDIGDVVKVDMIFSENNREEEIFKLVTTNPAFDMNSEIKEISINSPAGYAIYRKKVGEVVTYKVMDREFTLEIKERMNLTFEEDSNNLKRTR